MPPAWRHWPRSCSGATFNSSPRPGDNFEVPVYPGLLLKESYWRWPQPNLAGNTIDFFVQVLGLSFHQAISEITAA